MDPAPRYSVFISSTLMDLREERQQVAECALGMRFIPLGMENFPAFDEEQFKYICKVIDQADYYLLIIGGRYGSLDADGVSFTEREFDYAVENEIPVVALLHGNPGELPEAQCEQTPEGKAALQRFREKVATDRLVAHWTNSTELVKQAQRSLDAAREQLPRPGWIRGPQVASGGSRSIGEVIEFESADEQAAFLVGALQKAETVYDLTWAKFERFAVQDDSRRTLPEYLERIRECSNGGTAYFEIFIFDHEGRVRRDRLAKLNFHYQRILRGDDTLYSCAHHDDSPFPRLQFTVIDRREVLFTSAQNLRCVVRSEPLAAIFAKYFEEAWSGAKVLIDDGAVVEAEAIEAVLARATPPLDVP